MSSKASQAASSLLTCKLAGSGEANPNLPRPQHFVTRGDGSITPLIAVDELPESIRIVGVPAIISQAATLNMMDLGFQERIRTKYIVEIPEDTGSGNTGNPSQKSSKTESIIILQEKRDEPPKTTGMEENTVSGVDDVEQWRLGVKTVDETQAAIDAVVAANAKSKAIHSARTPKALTPGVFGEKKYCTHWIRWGECDYMQQGCKYRHEMPDDDTLISIGIRTVPKWYKDANAPKNGWVERPPPSERVWRDSPSRTPQRIDPYRLPYTSAGELFPQPFIPSDEVFRPPYQSPAEVFRAYAQPPRQVPGPRPPFGPNGFTPRPAPFAPSSNGLTRTISQPYAPPSSKFPGPQNQIGVSASRFPATSSPPHRRALTGTTLPLIPASIPILAFSTAPLSAPVPTPASVAPPSPFSPPLTTQPFSPQRTTLPTSLAPTPRSLFPFLPNFDPHPTPVPQIKTPAPRHRRLFPKMGEPTFVENSMSSPGKENNSNSTPTTTTGVVADAGKWKELGKGIEELLVDFEE